MPVLVRDQCFFDNCHKFMVHYKKSISDCKCIHSSSDFCRKYIMRNHSSIIAIARKDNLLIVSAQKIGLK